MRTTVLKDKLVAMLEANMGELSMGTDEKRIERSRHLEHYYRGLGKDREGNAVIRWKIPSQDPKRRAAGVLYDCYIAIVPSNGASLFTLARANRDMKSRIAAIRNANVKCFCTCPDFNWSGARYNMNKHGTLERGFESVPGVPDGSNIKPNIRDPEGKMLVCKHLLSAFKGMATNASSIMKDAANAKFSPDDDPREKAESATGEFFKTEKEVRGKPEKEQVNVAQELMEEEPVKLDAADDALNSLAMATAKTAEGQEPDTTGEQEPKADEKAPDALETVGLGETPEPPKDNKEQSLNAVGLETPEKKPEPAPGTPKDIDDMSMDEYIDSLLGAEEPEEW